MRRLIAIVGLLILGCTDSAPTGAASSRELTPSFSGSGGTGSDSNDDAGQKQFNTQLRAANEIPTSTSTSRGDARVRVPASGPIVSRIEIDNRGGEIIRFCHIHWIDPNATPAGTGPIIWFLTPTGVSTSAGPGLQLVTRRFLIGQDADYVANGRFGADNAANEAAARAALLADPSKFYVNCHSNAFPAGFVRGNLPNNNSHH